jgi:hypothetical protein
MRRVKRPETALSNIRGPRSTSRSTSPQSGESAHKTQHTFTEYDTDTHTDVLLHCTRSLTPCHLEKVLQNQRRLRRLPSCRRLILWGSKRLCPVWVNHLNQMKIEGNQLKLWVSIQRMEVAPQSEHTCRSILDWLYSQARIHAYIPILQARKNPVTRMGRHHGELWIESATGIHQR